MRPCNAPAPCDRSKNPVTEKPCDAPPSRRATDAMPALMPLQAVKSSRDRPPPSRRPAVPPSLMTRPGTTQDTTTSARHGCKYISPDTATSAGSLHPQKQIINRAKIIKPVAILNHKNGLVNILYSSKKIALIRSIFLAVPETRNGTQLIKYILFRIGPDRIHDRHQPPPSSLYNR